MSEAPGAACELEGKRRRTRTIVGVVVFIAAIVTTVMLWPAQAVETVAAERRDVVELVVASGRLRTPHRSDLGCEVAGVADAVLVDVGARVTESQELVRLRADDARRQLERTELVAQTARAELDRVKAGPLRQELSRAEAELEAAQAIRRRDEGAYARLKKLVDSGSVTNAQLDDAKAAFDQATARVASARHALEVLRATPRAEDVALAEARVAEALSAVRIAEEQVAKRVVRSPFAGVIVSRDVEPGQGVSPGRPLLTVADVDHAEVFVETDENNLARLKVGQTATVTAAAYPDRPFKATLARIDPVVDPQRGVVALRLRPASLPPFALVDMTVDVNIVVAEVDGAVALPVSALLREGETWRAMRIDEGTVRAVEVEFLGSDGAYAAVSGLPEGGRVVREATKVAPGERVREVRGE